MWREKAGDAGRSNSKNLKFHSTSSGQDYGMGRRPKTPVGDWDAGNEDEYTTTTPSMRPTKTLPVKWHRWSYQRTEPSSWEDFREVKPKQPPRRHAREADDGGATKQKLDELKVSPVMTQKSERRLDAVHVGLLQRSMSAQSVTMTSKEDSSAQLEHLKVTTGRMLRMLETRGPIAVDHDSQVLGQIRAAFIEMLVSAADPQGDFSWTVSDPRAYHLLPIKLIECRDWNALRLLMCDLRFLWRKVVETGPTSVLRTYLMAGVPLSVEGKHCERLKDYYEFVLEHVKLLSTMPSSIFQLGINCRQPSVRRETRMLAHQYEKLIDQWHGKFKSDGGGSLLGGVSVDGSKMGRTPSGSFLRSSSRDSASRRSLNTSNLKSSFVRGTASGAAIVLAVPEADHLVHHVSAFETMRFVNIKVKLHTMKDCGISTCLSEETQRKLHVLTEGIVQKCQSARSRLLEKGLEAYSEENRTILGLDANGGEGDSAELEQPKQFLDLAGLWDESDKVEFVTLSIYIPPKTWNNEKNREQYETNLCNQVAEAAHAPLELIDIVDIACPEKDVKKGMHGKCLIKCMELVKGLQVTVVQGRDFPVIDQVGKSDPLVSLQMRTSRSRAGGGKSPRHTKMAPKLPRMALKAQQTVHQTASRPGELHAVNPRFDEIFSFLVYDLGQDLVVTCYDAENGGKTPIGEVVLSIADVFSQCHAYDDESFERTCQLCKPGTRKPVLHRSMGSDGTRTPTLQLKFRFFTHQSPNGVSPQSMANDVMKQSSDPNSQLRLGCLVMGPAYHDEEGSWDTVRVYLSSSYGEHHAERRYLNRFVFPALAVDCLQQRLHFKWTDLSDYGAHGVKDDVVKRINAIDQCRIRGYNRVGENIESTFVVALLGEKRGRLLDPHDIRRLEKAESVGIKKGQYEWAIEAAKAGVSVQELELRAGLLNNPEGSVAVVCLRDPFMENEKFQVDVPKHVKNVFSETDIVGRTAVGHLKRNVMRTSGQAVVQYTPHYLGYSPPVHEVRDDGTDHHVHADKGAEGVQLGHLEEFGLEVFERLWRDIRQRFPSSRAKSHVNQYVIEHLKQADSVRSYVRVFHMASGGTQKKTLAELLCIASFVNEVPPVSFFVGAHGSGKSSILARLVYDLKVIPHQKSDVLEVENDEGANHEGEYRSKSEFTTKLRPTAMIAMIMTAKARLKSKLSTMPVESDDVAQAPMPKPKKRAFNPLADPDDDFEFGDEEVGDGPTPDAPVDLTEEEQAVAEGAISSLLTKGATPNDIIFLSKHPRIVFFIKSMHHTTEDVLAYLCSSLLRRQDLEPPSWKRLEHLVRCRVFERPMLPNDKTTPVLFVLDGLDLKERNEVQAIVSSLKGKARAIMSISSNGDADSGAKMARNWSGSQVILNGPLANRERTEILGKLFDRLVAKKRPAKLDIITLRQASESPLYLSVVASYIASLIAIYKKPASLKELQKDAVSLVAYDFLPVIEKIAGEQQVRNFLEVVMQEPTGRTKKDVHVILSKCGVPMVEYTLRALTDSFRPFSDPVNREHGGPLSLNRHFFREAVRKRYHQSKLSSSLANSLNEYRIAADAQEVRLNMIRFGEATTLREKSLMEEDDEDDCQWLSDQEEASETSSVEEEEDQVEEDSVKVHFGSVVVEANEGLFSKFSGSDEGLGDNRKSTMDMNELVKMLRWVDILPQHLTKTEIAKAFRAANRDHGTSGSADDDVHELDFREFLDCMRRLQDLYMNRLNMMGQEHEKAALLIQRRARGNMARKEVRAKKNALDAAKQGLPSADDMTDEDMRSIVKLQSMARMKKEKEKRQRQVIMQNAESIKEVKASQNSRPAVKGKKNRPGVVGVVQSRLKMLFDTVQDAFVFIDNDGNDNITKVEFARGLQRCGIIGGSISKLSAMVAADGIIDVLEFMRLFAWQDVRHVDKSIAIAKVSRAMITEKATERLKEIQEGKQDDDEFPEDGEVTPTNAGSGSFSESSKLKSLSGSMNKSMMASKGVFRSTSNIDLNSMSSTPPRAKGNRRGNGPESLMSVSRTSSEGRGGSIEGLVSQAPSGEV